MVRIWNRTGARRVAICIASGLTLGLLILLLVAADLDDEPAIAVAAPQPPAIGRRVVLPPAPAVRRGEATGGPGRSGDGDGDGEEIEVCGLGFMPREDALAPAVARRMTEMDTRLREQVATSLQQAAGVASAVGIWLESANAIERAMAPFAEREQACRQSADCLDRLDRETEPAREQASRPLLDALARSAVASTDPATYAVALRACRHDSLGPGLPGQCRLLTVERWAQIDPDNAVPWFHLLAEAMARHDDAAAEEALYRASTARSSRLYGDALLATAEPTLTVGFPGMDGVRAATEIAGIEQAWAFPDYDAVIEQLCSKAAVRDSNRRQTCDALATMLLDRGSTFVERGVALRLGRQLGWDAARLETLARETDAILAATTDAMSGQDAENVDCPSWQHRAEMATRRSRIGELAMAREQLARSGHSIDELADRQARRRLAADRAATASAPASASS